MGGGWKDFAKYQINYKHLFVDTRFYRKNIIFKVLRYAIVFFQQKLGLIINADIDPEHSFALFSITLDCAKYIVENEQNLKKRYKYALAPDEVVFITLVENSKFKEKIVPIYNGARFIVYPNPDPDDNRNSPKTFKISDLQTLLTQPEHVCFARKFQENVDFEIVQKIRDKILEDESK